jgi:hypothetical protein
VYACALRIARKRVDQRLAIESVSARDSRTGNWRLFELPACQVPTGSSPYTSLSVNSSIMLRSHSSIVSIRGYPRTTGVSYGKSAGW